VQDVDTFRTMMRSDADSGYVFFSNYQRYVPGKDLGGIQVEANMKSGSVTIPAQPLTIPKDAFGVWPVNLNMNGAVLEYSTAQPFARFAGQDADTYFFAAYAGIAPEFAFKGATVSQVVADGQAVQKLAERTLVEVAKPTLESVIQVTPTSGKPVRIVVLPHDVALHAFRLDIAGVKRLVVTDGAHALESSDGIDVRSMGRRDGSIWVFPSMPALRAGGSTLQGEQAGLFRRFKWSVPEKSVTVAVEDKSGADASRYVLTVPEDALQGQNVYDVYLDFDQISNYMTVKSGNKLIGDWYYYGPHYRPSLRHWAADAIGKKLEIELQPLTPDVRTFIEDRYRPDFTAKKSYAELRSVTATPLYRITLNPAE
jgi:hypothetical protein